MKNLRPDLRWSARQAFFDEYGRMDPAAALKEVLQERDTGPAMGILSNWATADAGAAAAALPGLPLTDAQKKEAYRYVAEAMSGSDPANAVAWLGQVKEEFRAAAASSVMSSLATTDVARALAVSLDYCGKPGAIEDLASGLEAIAVGNPRRTLRRGSANCLREG